MTEGLPALPPESSCPPTPTLCTVAGEKERERERERERGVIFHTCVILTLTHASFSLTKLLGLLQTTGSSQFDLELTFPSSLEEVIFKRNSLSLGSEAYSASSFSTLVRGGEVMST